MSARVVVTDTIFPNLAQEEAAARAAEADFEGFQCKTADDVAAAVKDADVAVVQFAPFTEAAAKAVKPGATVIRYGVGYDNIDVKAADAAGLKVGYVPDYCTDEVADHTAALALSLLRKLPTLDASVRVGEWAAVKHAKPLKPFGETVFGFFGIGQIGSAVLQRIRGFGFRVIASDPGLTAQEAHALGITLVDADTLLATADIITCHAPATEGTIGFFNAANLAKMQKHALLVNTARGQLINENDLAEALRNGTIAGAALDVFEAEPLPDSSPLRDAPGLILTPHAAWYSEVAIDRLQGLVAEDITLALKGEGPRKPVPG
ncbi:MAG: C-terminal binding protein [Rhizobiales bacterium]|nr:C-terminal binding protein [Hyphomicrobiales bacterium]MBO6698812.1 C-terminal binding protein [Hyphomicrobiales bacterium]MBO6734935.1 C-terminal binding protein [Hyphomicrobiales bacterium]MBO6911259.1 C-terminal binding protein [Hyphomicrobiales bacterium]MBO6955737.1 C-terminal binding protein [Hyphomicrobiales bacterium]